MLIGDSIFFLLSQSLEHFLALSLLASHHLSENHLLLVVLEIEFFLPFKSELLFVLLSPLDSFNMVFVESGYAVNFASGTPNFHETGSMGHEFCIADVLAHLCGY